MTSHFRPDNVVRIDLSRRERRRMRRMFDSAPDGQRFSAATVGVVLAAAIGIGLAAGIAGSELPAVAASAPDMPIRQAKMEAAPTAAGAANIPFFGYCTYGGGTNCVVDGDTFYLGGDKVRIAGIDAPETHPPRCADEQRLGEAATHRLRDLLNSGEVSLSRIDRDEDVYGRKLRNVAVGGADVGAALVGEGLARDYGTGRRSWCG